MKKTTYAVCGALLVAMAVLVQRIDGGGGDTVGLLVLGIGLLIASADVPQRKRVA